MTRTATTIHCMGATLLVGSLLGCSGAIKDVVQKTTPAVVAGATEGLARPQTQRDLLTVTNPKRVEDLTRQASAGVVDGTLDTLEDRARDKRIEELSNRLVDGALTSFDTPAHQARIESLVSGVAGTAVGAVIDATMARSFSDSNQAKMRDAMRATVGELIGVVFESVRKEMGTPEERAMVMQTAAHDVTKGATLGFQDAVDEAKKKRADGEKSKDEGSLLIAAADAPATAKRIMVIAGVATAAAVLALVLALLWSIRRNRARRAELEQRDEALLLLTEAIKSTETQPWSNELREIIKNTMRDRDGGEHVRKVLRGKQELRLRPSVA